MVKLHYYCLLVDLNKRNTKNAINKLRTYNLVDWDRNEYKFWKLLIKEKLKPVSQKFTQVKDVQKSLESLRNLILSVLLLMNLMWIVLLSSFTFYELQDYSFDPRAFQLLFLAVYGLIIVIQFFTMIAHRLVTFIHYLGRVRPREVLVRPWTEQELFEIVTVRYPFRPSTET